MNSPVCAGTILAVEISDDGNMDMMTGCCWFVGGCCWWMMVELLVSIYVVCSYKKNQIFFRVNQYKTNISVITCMNL